jgi:hypothetical protein
MAWILILFGLLQIVALVGWYQTRLPWVRFAAAQVFQIEAAIAGWLLLIPFCLAQEWAAGPKSIKDGRLIDAWTWGPLGWVYDNPEDGVSGQQAIVFTTGAAGPYMPNAWAPWRAYCWSALRNSCDGLKYRFAVPGGPLKKLPYTLFGKRFSLKIGWQPENGLNVPVFSPFGSAS